MIRKIIEINTDKCNGCGLCAKACHEGAISMVDGKATLMRYDYCDGLGDCLPVCPVDAIHFVEREAAEYDEEAVKKNQQKQSELICGCSGTHVKEIEHDTFTQQEIIKSTSQLKQWPVQIKLVPTNAPYFDGSNLLIAADCSAYAYANFHEEFIKDKITLIGCPKLDMIDYTDKITEIITNNDIKSVTVVRMEVPCCGGIENAVKTSLQNSGKFLPWSIVTISTSGKILL